jgi:hypothetical protein
VVLVDDDMIKFDILFYVISISKCYLLNLVISFIQTMPGQSKTSPSSVIFGSDGVTSQAKGNNGKDGKESLVESASKEVCDYIIY